MDTAALSAALMTARAEARRTPNTLVRKEAGGVKLVWQVIQQRGQPEAELLRLDGGGILTQALDGESPEALGAHVLVLLPVDLLLESHTHRPGMLGLVLRTEKDRRRCLKCDWNTASTQKGSAVSICTPCAEKARLACGRAPVGYDPASHLTRENP